ncbi:beta-aspartyl-peptidase, partial [Oxalobacteraceae bacterium OM1]
MNEPYVLAVHGGAGTISPGVCAPEVESQYRRALHNAVAAGEAVLVAGGSAIDAVTASVVFLENCPLFNAGHGAVFTAEGKHELDASIMDGRTLRAGAASCVRTVRNPVLLARAIMEDSGNVLLTADGADAYARECGLELVDPAYLSTPERHAQLLRAREDARGARLDHDAATEAT